MVVGPLLKNTEKKKKKYKKVEGFDITKVPDVLPQSKSQKRVAVAEPKRVLSTEEQRDKKTTRIRAIEELEQSGIARVPGVDAEVQLDQIARARTGRELAGQVGDVKDITPERLAELQAEVSAQAQRQEGRAGALREGGTSALQRGIVGAAGGAVVGGPVAPVTAAVGFVGGVASGFISEFSKARKSEAKEDVQNIAAEYGEIKNIMERVVTSSNENKMTQSEALETFNVGKYRILELEAQLKYLTDSNLKDYLSDGGDELVKIQTFLYDGGIDGKEAELQSAFVNPSTRIPF
jgi:hypothetical protein